METRLKPKILILNSDSGETTNICSTLAREGFEVLATEDGNEVLQKLHDALPSLVILDDQLSRIGSLDICSRICQLSLIRIILLGREDELSLVEGLERGADFYMSKPISLAELAARVKALLRRRRPRPLLNSRGQLDAEGQSVPFAGKTIELSLTEFRLLACLMLNQGKIVSYEDLLAQVWGSKSVAWDTAKYYVARLRQKLDHSTPHYIFNHRGIGYRFGYFTEQDPA